MMNNEERKSTVMGNRTSHKSNHINNINSSPRKYYKQGEKDVEAGVP
jgi:hypothetical protein